MKTTCPICGSTELTFTTESHQMPIPFGPNASWEEDIFHCGDCGESGDLAQNNDEKIDAAISHANASSINHIIESLGAQGIKMAYLERSLNLPARTIAKWKSGSFSASSLALLRTIRTYPWIIEVADANFDSGTAKFALIQNAARALNEAVSNANMHLTIDTYTNEEKSEIRATVRHKTESANSSIVSPSFSLII